MIGAGISIAAYVVLTRHAPTALLGVFAAAGFGATASALTRSVSSYVDYRVAAADNDLRASSLNIRTDVDQESQEFDRLVERLADITRKIDFLYESETIDLALYWRLKEEYQAKIPADERTKEEYRARNSSLAYISSAQEMKISDIGEENARLEESLRTCIVTNKKVEEQAKKLEYSLARLES